MNVYLFLFLLCFAPLASHRYGLMKSVTTLYESSDPREPPSPPPPPARSLLYRSVTYLRKIIFQKPPKLNRKPPPPPPPSPDYSRFAPPPVVKAPHTPSPVSRWFRRSASARDRRASLQRTYYQRAPPLSSYTAARNAEGVITMMSFLGTEGSNADVDMVVLMAHIQAACKHIAAILSSPRELQYNYEPYFEGGKRDDSRSLKSISVRWNPFPFAIRCLDDATIIIGVMFQEVWSDSWVLLCYWEVSSFNTSYSRSGENWLN